MCVRTGEGWSCCGLGACFEVVCVVLFVSVNWIFLVGVCVMGCLWIKVKVNGCLIFCSICITKSMPFLYVLLLEYSKMPKTLKHAIAGNRIPLHKGVVYGDWKMF